MKGSIIELFSYEITQSLRATKERITEHPIMTAWFIILLFAGFGTMLGLVEYAAGLEDPLIEPSRGDVLFSIFFFILAKASAETVDNTLRNKQLKHLMTSPIDVKKVMFTRLFKEVWYNLLLVALSMSIVAVLVPLFGIDLPMDYYFLPNLYVMLAVAPVIGFLLAVFSQLSTIRRKLVGLFLYGQSVTVLWWLTHSGFGPLELGLLVALVGVSSLLLVVLSSELFLEAWKHGVTTSTESAFRFHEAGDFLPKFISEPIRRVAEKEIFERWRRRESPATFGVVASISVGLLFMYTQFGPNPDFNLGMGDYFYPMLVGMAIYLAVVLQSVLPSLTLFSREGRRMWAIKTLPISSEDVVWGKSLALVLYSPAIPLLVAVPLPLILGYGYQIVLFSILSAFIMIFSFTGIGVWASAKFPNFDESNDGAPDVITMYTVLIMCLISSVFFIGWPFNIFQFDRVLGLLSMVFSLDMAALMLVILVKRSAKLYDSMELDM